MSPPPLPIEEIKFPGIRNGWAKNSGDHQCCLLKMPGSNPWFLCYDKRLNPKMCVWGGGHFHKFPFPLQCPISLLVPLLGVPFPQEQCFGEFSGLVVEDSILLAERPVSGRSCGVVLEHLLGMPEDHRSSPQHLQ